MEYTYNASMITERTKVSAFELLTNSIWIDNNVSLNKAIRHIERNIYNEEPEKMIDACDGVTILKCSDITDECNTVALEIKKLIKVHL